LSGQEYQHRVAQRKPAEDRLRLYVTRQRQKNRNPDGIVPGSIDNALNLGEKSPDYEIGVLWLSLC